MPDQFLPELDYHFYLNIQVFRSISEKSSPVIKEYGGDNLALKVNFDPPTGKIGFVNVLFLDNAILYAML